MTEAADVMNGVYAALIGRTAAGDTIARPGDLPTQPDQYPRIKLRYGSEHRRALGHGSIAFTTTVVIQLIAEVSEPASLSDDVAISTVDASLQALKREAERAIINSYPLFQIVQQLSSVDTQFAYSAQNTHLAGIQQDYAFEIFESAEDFAPLPVDDLTEIVVTDTNHPGAGFGVHYD